MKPTVVGCAGSFPSQESPASCYLLEAPFEGRTYRLLVDLGSGALGNLQSFCDLRDIDAIAISHMHADHCFDLSGLYVVSKYHPEGAYRQIPLYAPGGSEGQLAQIYGLHDGDDLSGTARPAQLAGRRDRAARPVRGRGASGRASHRVVRHADLVGRTHLGVLRRHRPDRDARRVRRRCGCLLVRGVVRRVRDESSELHLTGAEAGHYATVGQVGRLLVTHIPAWTDRAEVESDVKSTWDGPYEPSRPARPTTSESSPGPIGSRHDS
ncbi:MBL fold metallo-hydrolase [Aeromicrobium sp. UC242_57]|uniref:MBL fold metallo-hydrolase n=1 Tax=Aeromicrobium sp. UC242_57 TaxID=3374624 RepID=UPI0037B17FD8